MRKLYLVKHARPEIVPGVPAKDWLLSEEGREASSRLAGHFSSTEIKRVAASLEPKALETGRILAERLGVPFSTVPNLHEHRRESTEWVADKRRWEGMIRDFFRHPFELVFGEETADAAHSRFASAVQNVMNAVSGDAIIACHGTVITLLVARANQLDELEFWKRLGLPSVVEVEWPGLRLLDVIEQV